MKQKRATNPQMLPTDEEKRLLRKIIYTPILILIISSVVILLIVINNKITRNRNRIKRVENLLVSEVKSKIKNRVKQIIKKIVYQKNISERLLEKSLKEKVDIAYKVIDGIYKNNPKENRDETIDIIKNALKGIRYNEGRGYFFIYDLNCTNILLPISPNLEGKDFSNYVDSKGDSVVQNIAATLKKQDKTFYTWYYIEPNKRDRYYKKIGYNRVYRPLNIFIGTGEYLEEFEENMQKSIISEISKIEPKDNMSIYIIDKRGTELIGRYPIKFSIKKYNDFFTFDNHIYYASKIDGWGWSIVAGFSLNILQDKIISIKEKEDKNLTKTVMEIFLTYIIFIVILSLLLFKYSKKIRENFASYKKALKKEEELLLEREMAIKENEKHKEMRDILSYIAHQWRQPLNALSIQVSKLIMLKESNALSKKEEIRDLKNIENKIVQLSKIIDIFKDFFKQNTKDKRYFSLSKAIEEIIFIVNEECRQNSIDLTYNNPKEIDIFGNKRELQQAVINIINNSKEHIIQNSLQNGFIKVTTKRHQNRVTISIEDNAGGITCKIDHKKIYEPYFTTKKEYGNNGLGLYITKNIIEKHFKGKIYYKNSNKGAVFTIVLPIYNST